MIREEFQCSKALLNHDDPKDFSICCWQKTKTVSPVWVGYRASMFLYFLATVLYVIIWWMLEDIDKDEEKPKMLIYLTFWTYFIESFLFFWGLLVTAVDYVKERRGRLDEKLSVITKIFWVLYTTILPSALLVTVIFWSAVYDNKYFPLNALNLLVHAFNSIVIVIDFFLVAFPFRFLHIYMPVIYLTVYTIFSVIYELSGGTATKGSTPIYNILDWNEKPLQAVMVVLKCCALTVAIQTIFFFLYILKLWLRKKYITKE